MSSNTPYSSSAGIPFNAPSDRVSYYCQSVYVWEKNQELETPVPYDPTLESEFLSGVQAVGISSGLNPNPISDMGRFQKQAVTYGETEYEITIERVLGFESEMFYHVDSDQYADSYKENHILNKKNLGSKGQPVKEGSDYFSLRNYDITLLYTPDRFPRMANAVNRPNATERYLSESSSNETLGNIPHIITSSFREQDWTNDMGLVEDGGIDPLAGTSGSIEDNDRYDVISMTYRNCLISSISYSIGIDGVQESIVLSSKNLVHNINTSDRDPKDIRNYNLPNKEFFSVQAPYRYPSSPSYLWKKIEDNPASPDFKKVIAFSYSENNPDSGGVDEDNWYRVKAAPSQGMSVRRHHLDILRDSYGPSNLPTEVSNMFDLEVVYEAEIGSEYTNRTDRRKNLAIKSISIDLTFDYQEIPDMGKRAGSVKDQEFKINRFKYLSLPIEVSCSFEGLARQGMPYWNFLHESNTNHMPDQKDFDSIRNVDNIYTKSAGIKKYNDSDMNHLPDWMQTDREIKLVARAIYDGQEKFFLWDLGKRNYLVNISTSGGDTSGGEVTTTLSYTNAYSDAVLTKGDYNENVVPYDVDYPNDPL